MYPLNVSLPAPLQGYAVASNEQEHAALTALGYVPALAQQPAEASPAESDDQGHTVESARAALDAAGIKFDKRWGLARLLAELPA